METFHGLKGDGAWSWRLTTE